MADPWVSLLVAGTIFLVGFAAYLLFQGYRIPDFFVLMVLGALLGVIPVARSGPACSRPSARSSRSSPT